MAHCFLGKSERNAHMRNGVFETDNRIFRTSLIVDFEMQTHLSITLNRPLYSYKLLRFPDY